MIIVFITNSSINRIIYNIYYLSCNNIIRNHFTYIIRKVLVLNLVANGCVHETFGISKRFPIKLQLHLIRAETLDKPLTAKCFIHDVSVAQLTVFC